MESGYGSKFTKDVKPVNHGSMFRTCGSQGILQTLASKKSGGLLMGWLKNVFGRPETRSSYTDLRIQSALQLADGTGHVGDVRHTAALEACCSVIRERLQRCRRW